MQIIFTPTEEEYKEVRLSEWRKPKNRRLLWIDSAVGFVPGYFYADGRQEEARFRGRRADLRET
jgi:hypothetical protein